MGRWETGSSTPRDVEEVKPKEEAPKVESPLVAAVQAAADSVTPMQAEIDRLVALLRKLEWIKGADGVERCPCCRHAVGLGHDENCELAKALS